MSLAIDFRVFVGCIQFYVGNGGARAPNSEGANGYQGYPTVIEFFSSRPTTSPGTAQHRITVGGGRAGNGASGNTTAGIGGSGGTISFTGGFSLFEGVMLVPGVRVIQFQSGLNCGTGASRGTSDGNSAGSAGGVYDANLQFNTSGITAPFNIRNTNLRGQSRPRFAFVGTGSSTSGGGSGGGSVMGIGQGQNEVAGFSWGFGAGNRGGGAARNSLFSSEWFRSWEGHPGAVIMH